jgi:hypothetical protein
MYRLATPEEIDTELTQEKLRGTITQDDVWDSL